MRTIWLNDFTNAKRLLLDHTMKHHPAFRRAAAGDLLAMKPERHATRPLPQSPSPTCRPPRPRAIADAATRVAAEEGTTPQAIAL